MIDLNGKVIWLWGLSGSGKTTLADLLEKTISESGVKVQRLDGDIVRGSLTRDLGFSIEDRFEHIRRVSLVADLLSKNGICVIASFITPIRAMRIYLRKVFKERLELIYVDCDLYECMKRDAKGLYSKALAGDIKEFTGLTSPFDEPEAFDDECADFDICIATENGLPGECAEAILNEFKERIE